MRVRGPGAAGECQVRLLERRGRDGVRLLGELDYVESSQSELSHFVFQEKKRIMLRMNPPGHENAIIDNYVPIYRLTLLPAGEV